MRFLVTLMCILAVEKKNDDLFIHIKLKALYGPSLLACRSPNEIVVLQNVHFASLRVFFVSILKV